MKKLLFALILLVASSAHATLIDFTAKIDGVQPVPPSGSLAFGTAVLQLDDVLNTLSFVAVTTNVLLQAPEVAAQLHFGAVGANGAAWADLPLGPLKNITLDLNLLGACVPVSNCTVPLLAGDTYVLLTTEAFGDPQGEIRGQIVPVSEPVKWVLMLMGLSGLSLVAWKPV